MFAFQVSVIVMCHTRELAFQISKEYERFSKYMSGIKVKILRLLVNYFVPKKESLQTILH